MNPLIIPVEIILLIFGINSVFKPLNIVRLLYIWPKYIFPKVFPEGKFLSDFKNKLDILYNKPDLYEFQNNNQIVMIQITGIASLFISILSICGIFTSSVK